MDTRQESGHAHGSVTLSISGMRCGGCARRVKHALSSVPGATRVAVDFAHSRAVVEGTAHHEALIDAVKNAGYSVRALDKIRRCD
jgi:copper chaperone CopZ